MACKKSVFVATPSVSDGVCLGSGVAPSCVFPTVVAAVEIFQPKNLCAFSRGALAEDGFACARLVSGLPRTISRVYRDLLYQGFTGSNLSCGLCVALLLLIKEVACGPVR